jgi:hypothetical protein
MKERRIWSASSRAQASNTQNRLVAYIAGRPAGTMKTSIALLFHAYYKTLFFYRFTSRALVPWAGSTSFACILGHVTGQAQCMLDN